jgi:hypothetical protein
MLGLGAGGGAGYAWGAHVADSGQEAIPRSLWVSLARGRCAHKRSSDSSPSNLAGATQSPTHDAQANPFTPRRVRVAQHRRNGRDPDWLQLTPHAHYRQAEASKIVPRLERQDAHSRANPPLQPTSPAATEATVAVVNEQRVTRHHHLQHHVRSRRDEQHPRPRPRRLRRRFRRRRIPPLPRHPLRHRRQQSLLGQRKRRPHPVGHRHCRHHSRRHHPLARPHGYPNNVDRKNRQLTRPTCRPAPPAVLRTPSFGCVVLFAPAGRGSPIRALFGERLCQVVLRP